MMRTRLYPVGKFDAGADAPGGPRYFRTAARHERSMSGTTVVKVAGSVVGSIDVMIFASAEISTTWFTKESIESPSIDMQSIAACSNASDWASGQRTSSAS